MKRLSILGLAVIVLLCMGFTVDQSVPDEDDYEIVLTSSSGVMYYLNSVEYIEYATSKLYGYRGVWQSSTGTLFEVVAIYNVIQCALALGARGGEGKAWIFNLKESMISARFWGNYMIISGGYRDKQYSGGVFDVTKGSFPECERLAEESGGYR